MVNRLSLIQAITPSHAQGRLHATLSVIEGCAMLAGVFFGGVLGERIGLRPTLFVACGGRMFSVLWLALSPVRTLRGFPPAIIDQQDALTTDSGPSEASSRATTPKAPTS